MCKKLITFFVLLIEIFTATSSISQVVNRERSIIIFSSKNTFLVPQIESIVGSLRNENTRSMLFNKVINFNRIEDNLLVRKLVTNRASSLDLERFFYNVTKLGQTHLDQISEDLRNYDLLLFVNVNTLNSIIECQITVYNTLPKENLSASKSVPLSNLYDYKSISFFIDPSKDYTILLENSLKKLFPESNFSPIAIISSNNDSLNNVLVGVEEPLKLEATSSYDKDTPPEQLKYKWRLINSVYSNKAVYNTPVQFNSEIAVQNFTFKNIGLHKLGLTVFDGVSYSKEDTVVINVVERPAIYLPSTKREYIFDKYVIQSKRKLIDDNIIFEVKDKFNSQLITNIYEANTDTSSLNYKYGAEKLNNYFYEMKMKGLGRVSIFETNKYYLEKPPMLNIDTPILVDDSLGFKTYTLRFYGKIGKYHSKIGLYTLNDKLTSEKQEVDLNIKVKSVFNLGIDFDLISRDFEKNIYTIDTSGRLTTSKISIKDTYLAISPFISLNLFKFLSVGISLSAINRPKIVSYQNYNANLFPKLDSLKMAHGSIFGSETKSFQFAPIGKLFLIFPFGSIRRSLSFSTVFCYTANFYAEEKVNIFKAKLKPDLLWGFRFQYSLHKRGIPVNMIYTIYGSILNSVSVHGFSYSSASPPSTPSIPLDTSDFSTNYYVSSFTITYHPFSR